MSRLWESQMVHGPWSGQWEGGPAAECACDTPWEQKHLLWARMARVTCVDLSPSTSASRSWGGVPIREHVIRGGWPVSPAPVEGQGETRGGAETRLSPQGPGQTRLAQGECGRLSWRPRGRGRAGTQDQWELGTWGQWPEAWSHAVRWAGG